MYYRADRTRYGPRSRPRQRTRPVRAPTQSRGPYHCQSLQTSHQIQHSGSCPPARDTVSFWHQSQVQRGRRLRSPLSTNTPETQEGEKEETSCTTYGPRWSVSHWSRLLQSLSEEVEPVRQCGMQVWWAWTDCRTYNHRLPFPDQKLAPSTRDQRRGRGCVTELTIRWSMKEGWNSLFWRCLKNICFKFYLD